MLRMHRMYSAEAILLAVVGVAGGVACVGDCVCACACGVNAPPWPSDCSFERCAASSRLMSSRSATRSFSRDTSSGVVGGEYTCTRMRGAGGGVGLEGLVFGAAIILILILYDGILLLLNSVGGICYI